MWRKNIIIQNTAAALTDPLLYFINMSLILSFITPEFYNWKSVLASARKFISWTSVNVCCASNI